MPAAVAIESGSAALLAAKADFSNNGVAVLEGVLNPRQITEVRDILLRFAGEEQAFTRERGPHAFDRDQKNGRVTRLVTKHAVFRDLLFHPVALELVRHALGPRIRLSNFTANVTTPGSQKAGMHADQGFIPSPWPPFPVALNIIWALDDFNADNATHYVPGSHRSEEGPEPFAEHPAAKPFACPAGSIVAMDGRVWHQTGANRTDKRRAALLAYYTRSYIVPQWEYYETKPLDSRVYREILPDALVETLTTEMRDILGLGSPASHRNSDLHWGDASREHDE